MAELTQYKNKESTLGESYTSYEQPEEMRDILDESYSAASSYTVTVTCPVPDKYTRLSVDANTTQLTFTVDAGYYPTRDFIRRLNKIAHEGLDVSSGSIDLHTK